MHSNSLCPSALNPYSTLCLRYIKGGKGKERTPSEGGTEKQMKARQRDEFGEGRSAVCGRDGMGKEI